MPEFLRGGGETGALIAAHDWSATPLGPIAGWPQSLRAVLGFLLRSPVPIVMLWGEDGIMLYNDGYSVFAGGRHPEQIGMPVREGWPEVADFNDNVMKVGLAGGTLAYKDQELTLYRHGTAEQVWMDLDYSPVLDDDGRPAGVLAIVIETTERVAAERALRDERDRSRDVLDHMGDAFALLDRDLRIVEMNAAALRLESRPPGEVIGKTHWEAHPDAAPEVGELYRAAITEGRPRMLEHRYVWPDGRETWIDMRAYPVDQGLAVFYRDISDRKRDEAAVAESEKRFRNMADQAPVMMWVTDPSGVCTYLNRRWYEFTGQADGAGEGYGWLDAVHPDDMPVAQEAFLTANALQQDYRVEFRIRRADGVYRWAIDAAAARFAADGGYLGYVGSVIDIEERREAEAALQASTARAEALAAEQAAILSQLAEGVIVTDRTGRITFVNDAASRIHGVARLDIEPDAYAETYHLLTMDHRPFPTRELPLARAVLDGETVTDAPWRIRRPDGSEVVAVGSARPVLDAAGGTLGAVLTLRDDTQRAEAERLLRENEARLRALTDNLPSGMVYQIATGRDGGERRFLYVSQSHLKLTGVPAEAVLADSSIPYRLILPEYRPAMVAAEADALAGRKPFDIQVRFRRADGEVRWSRIISAPRDQPDGTLVWDGIQVDITDQKNAETLLVEMNDELERRVAERTAELEEAQEALRQAQKMEAVGQLTGGIAHDFNNLLTGVIGSLDMMQRRLAKGETDKIERYATTAMTAANRAAALTHRLLAFSRRQPLDPKPVNANRLVTGMEELLRRTIGESVQLETVTAGGLWQTLCDPHQLESAILNLAINARDAMPEGGKLTIETCNAHLDTAYAAKHRDVVPGQYICICVTDTGAGMTKDTIEKAFEPFFTTKPIGQGTGLGLSMIYGFTRQSEGYARIYSELGQGTTIKLYLPRYYGEAEDAEENHAEALDARRAEAGEVVLVVEDESAVRGLVVDVLEELGYHAVEAADGPSGLKLLQSKMRLDLLVTDIGLPGLNGRQLADAARQLRPELRILFMTGYAENATIANGFLEPGMEMITKPFAIEALVNRIRDMIERT
ncbi:PAS domain S-box protein [Sphingomonas sp.]|jgi:PAS domain S-box-containing protein|uniref:PAS domain S-box protein n=1 Tax=Sphingomonas sp. TaxID=28214 RepID=UPI002D7FFB23|nr:PAS domain S-box protein [Sphingomonas sp.]HEU0045431.1 PAS domain S-box protein [Sphingomonas sp.]